MKQTDSFERLKQQFMNPPPDLGPFPFWFLNDELDKDEMTRQIQDFHAKGVSGLVLHPRMGLPADLEYLGDCFMDFMLHAVTELEKRGMKAILYDEGMYPSGCAHGLVVKRNPDFASRGICMREYLPGDLRPMALLPGENLVAQVVAKMAGKKSFCFIETTTSGTIRGIHEGEDDGQPDAPASADLLNPDAVRAFIEITHERYFNVLGKYFGNTIIAMFTDEPDIMGRRALPGLFPWTRGFLAEWKKAGNEERDLPALWLDSAGNTEIIRRRYRQAVNSALASSYYAPLSKWCANHNIALTGHPKESDDIGLLEHFQIPAQDVVWRWVKPGAESGISGRHSTLAKCGSDAARLSDRKHNANECFGCCGPTGAPWGFTADDMKWYLDWLFVRGVNMLFPHAFYYSIRGDLRRNERPPDVGPNNIWWPEYRRFTDYMKRMSLLLTDSVNQAQVAVLCEDDSLPWEICRPLYRHQIEFNYLPAAKLVLTECVISNGMICTGKQCYRAVVVQDLALVTEQVRQRLDEFITCGGSVVACNEIKDHEEVVPILRDILLPDLLLQPVMPAVRATHLVRDNIHLYMLTNEGETAASGRLSLGCRGEVQCWDAWSGTMATVPVQEETTSGLIVDFYLERRSSAIYCVSPGLIKLLPGDAGFIPPAVREIPISTSWRYAEQTAIQGQTQKELSELSSWTGWEGFEHFSGTVTYTGEFELSEDDLAEFREAVDVKLDLGNVGEIAGLSINSRDAGVAMWKPYCFSVMPFLKSGRNKIQCDVTNSLANEYNRASMPSGLIGPVSLRIIR